MFESEVKSAETADVLSMVTDDDDTDEAEKRTAVVMVMRPETRLLRRRRPRQMSARWMPFGSLNPMELLHWLTSTGLMSTGRCQCRCAEIDCCHDGQ